jgi:hypothetical protein
MSRLLGAVSADCHGAPAPRSAPGAIFKEQRALETHADEIAATIREFLAHLPTAL